MARIAIFHNLPSGGGKRALFEWTRRLAGRHELDVYTLSPANHAFCDLRPYVSNYNIVDFNPLPLYKSPWGRLNQIQRWRDLQKLEVLFWQIAAQIDAGGYDVVFSNSCQFTFIPILQTCLRTPSLYYLHEYFPNRVQRTFPRPYLKRSWKKRLLDRLDPFIPLYYGRLFKIQQAAVKNTDRLLANSEFTREQFEAEFHLQALVVHLGVDSASFYPLPEVTRGNHVLSVGELSPRKGFDFLVESLGLVPADRRPVLRLACNNQIAEERMYIENLAKQRGVALEIRTNLDSEQLLQEYNQAMLCVYSPVQEPFGLVPLEAMACGTAVLGVAEGGVNESVVDGVTGRLTTRDPHKFAEALMDLQDHPDECARLGKNGRESVTRQWTWEQSTSLIEYYLLETGRRKLKQ